MEKEEILITRNSRKTYIPLYVMLTVLFMTIAFIQFSGRELNFIAVQATMIFTLFIIASTELHRMNNLYEIHPSLLVHVKGILKKVTRRTDLLAVSDADISQNLWQMMLGYGNVSVRVFSQDSTMQVRNISDPSDFVDFLTTQRNNIRKSGGTGGMAQ